MYRFTVLNGRDLAAMQNHRVILAGEREPEWLRRAAEYARILPELQAEQRAARAALLRERGLVGRLRLVLGFA